MYFLSPKELSERWQVSERYIRKLCEDGRIEGAIRNGGRWKLPLGCIKPKDKRVKDIQGEDLQENPFAEADFLLQKLRRRASLEDFETGEIGESFNCRFAYQTMLYADYGVTPELCKELIANDMAVVSAPLELQLEVILFNRAWQYLYILALENRKRKSALGNRLLLDVYAILKRWNAYYAMDFREANLFFIGDTKFFPSRGREVRDDLKRLFYSYKKSKKHPIERIAELYLAFETIQPFETANGRIGMLLLNFELRKAGYPPIVIRYSEQKRFYAAYVSYREGRGTVEMQKLITAHVVARLRFFNKIVAQIYRKR